MRYLELDFSAWPRVGARITQIGRKRGAVIKDLRGGLFRLVGDNFVVDDLRVYRNFLAAELRREGFRAVPPSQKLKTMEWSEISDGDVCYLIRIVGKNGRKTAISSLSERLPGLDYERIDPDRRQALAKAMAKAGELGLKGYSIGSAARNSWLYRNKGAKQVFGQRWNTKNFDPSDYLAIVASMKAPLETVAEDKKGKLIEKCLTLDVNSLYPWAAKQLLPWGPPLFVVYGEPEDRERYPLAIVRLELVAEAKDGVIPFLGMEQDAKGQPTDYPRKVSGWRYLWEHELPFIQKCYKIEKMRITGKWRFKAVKGLLDDFLDDLYKRKEEAADYLDRFFAKKELVSFLGKFGSARIRQNVVRDDEGKISVSESESDLFYPPLFSCVIATARDRMAKDINAFIPPSAFVAAATDSITFVNEPGIVESMASLGLIGDEMGLYKIERVIDRCVWLRQKCYSCRLADGSIDCRVAGLPESRKLAIPPERLAGKDFKIKSARWDLSGERPIKKTFYFSIKHDKLKRKE